MVEFNIKSIVFFVIGLLICAIVFPLALTSMISNPIEQKVTEKVETDSNDVEGGSWFNLTMSKSNRFYIQYFIVVNESISVNISLYANDSLQNDFSTIKTLSNRTLQTQTFTNLTVSVALFIEFDNTTGTLNGSVYLTEFVDLTDSNSVQAIYGILPIIATVSILALIVTSYLKGKDEM